MPPKRAAKGKAAATAAKKPKVEDLSDTKKITKQLRAEDSKKKAGKIKVDSPENFDDEVIVFEDYAGMLNQTNISANNNKFYVVQLLHNPNNDKYIVWTRWGRVGEPGQSARDDNPDLEKAKVAFCKKFQSKTGNKWADRAKFVPKSGKYTLLEMEADDDDEEEEVAAPVKKEKGAAEVKCTLDPKTQFFLKLIFDKDMFNSTLQEFDLDTKKMPLGKISKSQIAKGFDVLDELETALNSKKTGSLSELSSKFYTVIPHSFGRKVPPVINSLDVIRQKRDMLLVLGDIVTAQEMEKEQAASKGNKHELQKKLDSLKASLKPVKESDAEYGVVEKYLKQTGSGVNIRTLFKLVRNNEEDRFKPFAGYSNRKLLWHGTNVAVVAAILKDGLRIMPHSGGRVGKGIYFASEADKSLGYTCFSNRSGVMFLNEVAMGDWHVMHHDGEVGYKQQQAPNKKQSTWAIGHTEPDPKMMTSLTFDGRKVDVPQGKVIKQPHKMETRSSFSQSEYVVYNEGQVRMRYVLLLQS